MPTSFHPASTVHSTALLGTVVRGETAVRMTATAARPHAAGVSSGLGLACNAGQARIDGFLSAAWTLSSVKVAPRDSHLSDNLYFSARSTDVRRTAARLASFN